jgi:hypothetical protein
VTVRVETYNTFIDVMAHLDLLLKAQAVDNSGVPHLVVGQAAYYVEEQRELVYFGVLRSTSCVGLGVEQTVLALLSVIERLLQDPSLPFVHA